MKRAIVAILAVLGGLVLLAGLFLVALSWAVLSPAPLPDRTVLTLDLEAGVVESVPNDALALAFERRRPTVLEVVAGLERAAADDRVVGLLVYGGSPGGWARTSELRDAVVRFRRSGKPAIYFAETFGEGGGGQAGYHLASGFDEIVLQPSGDVGLAPLVAEMPFLRAMLDTLDVEPRFDARWEYKDATEFLTEREFGERSREAIEALLESILTTVVDGVAEGRGLAPDSVRALVRDGPWMAREALAAGLVDRLGYRDEARERLRERAATDEVEWRALASYVERDDGRAWTRGSRVALVYGTGPFERGRGRWDPVTGGSSLGAGAVAEHIRSAVDDPRTRAILFRVDSPGGSYVASDVVRRELVRAREQGKPVVVSMGNTAASGGYLIAAGADRIVAEPTTLTGSIGVAGGKLVTEGFWERFGIEWDRIEVGGENTFYSFVEDFSDEEWARFQASLDRVYDEFVELVAEGRGMSIAEVDRVARGRVWTGRDALERGLVDGAGGFHEALRQVRELLELEPEAPLEVALYPAERTFVQLLLEDGWRVAVTGARPLDASGFAALRPLLERAAAAGLLGPRPGPLVMPPLEVPSP